MLGHGEQVSTVAFSKHDDGIVATGSWEHSIMIWDTQTAKAKQTLKGHTEVVNCVAFSPHQANVLASALGAETEVLISRETHELLQSRSKTF